MFYSHDATGAETARSTDHDAWLQKRKVPRLSLSMDVKTPHTSSSSMYPLAQVPLSPYGELVQMEVDEIILYRNSLPKAGQPVRANPLSEKETNPGFGECCSLDLPYPPHLPSSFYNSSPAASAAEMPSAKRDRRISQSYPQQFRGTRNDKTLYSHLHPSFPYSSPPQSTAASPLETSNPSPSSIQPSSIQPPPSLPLHQPRPSKRIPIVSLSQLAFACEDMEKVSKQRSGPYKHRVDLPSRNVYSSHHRSSPYSRYDREKQMTLVTSPRDDNKAGRYVRCGCGCDCMESYAVG